MNRLALFAVMVIFFIFPAKAQVCFSPEDTVIFARFLQYSEQSGVQNIVRAARFFIDTPYAAGTLEGDAEERLRVNLRELDCVTFVENVVALYLTLQSDRRTFADFCRILQFVRYRDGVIDGYLSRLHYASEWLENNRRKGIVSLPVLPYCRSFSPEVSFMSERCDAYPALKTHPDRCEAMKAVENNINRLTLGYIPKAFVKNSEKNFQNGDIVAITTRVRGLDVAHIGFVMMRNGRAYLLHASSEAKKVIASDEPLRDYLSRRKTHSGIIVAKPEPFPIFDARIEPVKKRERRYTLRATVKLENNRV